MYAYVPMLFSVLLVMVFVEARNTLFKKKLPVSWLLIVTMFAVVVHGVPIHTCD